MPRKPLPKRQAAPLKRRFRELVDWAFDGNLSMAADVLEMPFSTVQQYYQQGPKRIHDTVVARINSLAGLEGIGDWLIGRGRPSPIGKDKEVRLSSLSFSVPVGKNSSFEIPLTVGWRCDRVVERLKELAREPLTDKEALALLFSGIIGAEKVGILASPMAGAFFAPVTLRGALDYSVSPVEQFGFSRERARLVHQLCAFWEGVLDMSARRPAKRGAKRR